MATIKQIQVIPSEVGTSATTGSTSLRGTYSNLPQNANLIKRLQKITEGVFEGSSNLFADGDYDKIDNITELLKFLTQVIIRFDNDPDYYTKRDYQYLISLLYRSLLYLYETNSGSQETELLELQQQIEALDQSIEALFNVIDNRFNILSADIDQKQGLLTAGTGIDIDLNVVNATLDEDITVNNVNIGSYSNGITITAGTPLVDILKNILLKVIDVTAVAPKATLSGLSYTEEYGTVIPDVTATIKLTQGYFTPTDAGAISNQYMDCTIESISDDWAWEITDDMIATSVNTYTATSVLTFTVSEVIVTANTVIPKMSNGEDSSVSYTNTKIPVSGSIKVTPYYNLYFGAIDSSDVANVTAEQIRNLNKIQSKFPLSNKTVTDVYSGGGKSIIIACPDNYELAAVTDGMGNSLINNFRQKSTLDIPCGNGVLVTYNLYLYPITNGADQAYKNITFNLV